jgi:hypothetical protein
LIDRTTREFELDGETWGLVLGGKPIKAEDIAQDLKLCVRSIKQHLSRLRAHYYIETKRTAYGLVTRVRKSKKWRRSEESCTSGSEESCTSGSEESCTSGSEEVQFSSKRSAENFQEKAIFCTSNKTIQDNTKTKISPGVREVFVYWQEKMNHPQAKLTKDRQAKIGARLREGFTVDQIKAAIDGCKASGYHMGENDSKAVYDDLTLICRAGSFVERFIENGKRARQKVNEPRFV